MSQLSKMQCIACSGDVPPLAGAEIARLHGQLHSDWRVEREHHLVRDFSFPDFASALDLTNRIGALAEEQGHHPDLHLSWGKLGVEIWTHKIDGLTESDFVLAAKIDELAAG